MPRTERDASFFIIRRNLHVSTHSSSFAWLSIYSFVLFTQSFHSLFYESSRRALPSGTQLLAAGSGRAGAAMPVPLLSQDPDPAHDPIPNPNANPNPDAQVLDAPALQDDFYLNLVDWSSQNVLAVGLGTCVYLWSACTSKVRGICALAGRVEVRAP